WRWILVHLADRSDGPCGAGFRAFRDARKSCVLMRDDANRCTIARDDVSRREGSTKHLCVPVHRSRKSGFQCAALSDGYCLKD
ncbi:hypothetical protein, partial [Burkholderia pseudomallei]|uniref:hypothetical protein n=1 Tax=Burkholderia pseudomallei TaxID=28450 RepID=UPI001E3ABFF5